MLTERQKCEKNFHDQIHKNNNTILSSYGAKNAYKYYWELVPALKGFKVLDFGCGNGWVSIWLAKSGASVWAIDISSELVKKARRWAENEGLTDKIIFEEMAGENLTHQDCFFDLVLGSAILHHTDLDVTVSNLHKVLKQGGRALFIEPMNENFILRIWRRLTPWRRSPTEKALTYKDIQLIRAIFPDARFHFRGFFSILTEGLLILTPDSRIVMSANTLLDRLDQALLRLFPGLGKYSAVVIMDLQK